MADSEGGTSQSEEMEIGIGDAPQAPPPAPFKGPAYPSRKRPASQSPPGSIRNPRPMSDAELSKLSSKVMESRKILNETVINVDKKDAGRIKAATDQILTAFRTVHQAYKVLAERLDDYADLQEVLMKGYDREASNKALKEEMAVMVREEVAKAVKDQLSQAAAQPKPGPPTFASLFRETNNQETTLLSAETTQKPPTTEFSISPMIGHADKFASAMEVREKLKSVIVPCQFNLRVVRLINVPNQKTVRVIAESVDLTKLSRSEKLRDAGLCVSVRPKMRPRLVIRNVPTDIRQEDIAKTIIEDNMLEVDPSEVKFVYRYPARPNRRGVSCVIETSAKIRDKLLNNGRLYVGFTSCRIEDHILIKQCYNCLGFGHLARECQKPKVCANCAGPHSARECRDHLLLKCQNCYSAKMHDTAHSATDARNCPVLRRRIEDKTRSIDYADTTRDE